MKTFSNFCAEAYDAAVMSGSQVRKTGEGGRIGANRKKTASEMRRRSPETDAQGNRKPIQVKDRKDIGSQRQASTRVQQPTQERGSADVKARAAAAAKEESRKAAQARAAAKSSGESPSSAKPKPKAKEVEQQASKLLSKKKSAEVDLRPADQPKRKVVGIKRADRTKIIRDGGRKLRDLLIAAKSKKLGIPPEKVKLDKSFDIK